MKKNIGRRQIKMFYQNQKDKDKKKQMKKIKGKNKKKKNYYMKVR